MAQRWAASAGFASRHGLTLTGLRGRLKTFIRGGLFRNILSLYGVQAAHQILQLLTIPFLARMLGPSEWGRLAVAQSVALFVQLIVNYGFPFAATRDVARHRDDGERMAEIISDVMAAQVILSVVVSAGAVFVCRLWIPILFDHPLLLGVAIVAGLLGGVMPMWYFQGQERMGRMASLDIAGKMITVLGLFVFVRDSEDGWKMLAMQILSASIVLATAGREILRSHRIRWPSFHRVKNTFQKGFDMFVFTSASSTLSIGNVLLLGLFAPPHIVGYYAGAEKSARAFVGFLWPLNQALYPRINHLCHTDLPAAARLVLRSLAIMGGAGLLMGLGCFFLAPLVVTIVLGPGFEPAIPAMRLISFMVMIVPINIVLGLQWTVSIGLERPYSRSILVAIVLNVVLASLLVPQFGHLGMAATVTLSEFFVLGCILWILKRNRLSPVGLAYPRGAHPSHDVPAMVQNTQDQST
jgi:PST family polysaccharide transporter